jgi:prepilin-type N-terminal cleavage/methylation domain-containing protein
VAGAEEPSVGTPVGMSDERGFTLIEVMIAAVVVVVGLFGTLAMLDQAQLTTSSTKAREQGVALQREVIESARSIPFEQLTPTSIASRVKAMPNLGDASAAPGWTLVRRGVTYTATIGVCSVDDPADGTGTQDPALFCPPANATSSQCSNWLGIAGSVQGTAGAVSAAAAAGVGVGQCGIDLDLDGTVDGLVQADVGVCLLGTCNGTTDTNPEDYKRIVSLVTWDRGMGSRHAIQSTTVPNPGVSGAPGVTAVDTTAAFPSPSSPARFTATINRPPAAVTWYIDGTAQSTASNSGGSGTSWWFDWSLGTVSTGSTPNAGEVLDGSYVVGAKAFDAYGQPGTIRSKTVGLNRRKPYAPTGFVAGRNGGSVDFEWAANRERDLQGYRVYRAPSGSTVLVCTLTVKTTCRDTSPPSESSLNYYVVAVDKDASGALREGDKSATVTVGLSNLPPNPPTNLALTYDNGAAKLTWNASSGDPDDDSGDKVSFYRIYRDGTAFGDRYDRTGDASTLTWTDNSAGGTTHTYRVVAVDTNLAESTFLGPVTG